SDYLSFLCISEYKYALYSPLVEHSRVEIRSCDTARAGAAGGAAGAGAAGGATCAGDAGGGTGTVSAVSEGAARPRPYYVPLLQQVLGLPPSPCPIPPLLSLPPVQSQSPLQPSSPLPDPSPYSGPNRGLTERREPESCPVSPVSRATLPVRTARAGRILRPRPPPVPGTHSMTLRPSTAPQRIPLASPPASSLPDGPDPESDSLHAASPTVTRFLATAVIDPLFESIAASALVAELVDFAAACRLDYATSLVAESASASVCPPSIGDPDAPDIPTPRSYTEAIEGPYSSQWQAAMDAEMASWKSTGTYVDEVPTPGANIVSGMWIFRVKRPPGSPPVFKARYVARGFSQRQGVDFFQTFSPTPKMITLRVLLHVAAQHDYELHSLDFSTAILQGSLHEEIWLRRPPGFTWSFLVGTQWSLRRPVYGLCQAPREWHDTLRTTLATLGFAPSTADPSLFLRTNTTLPPFYVLVYIDDLIFATADTEALAPVKSELQKRHTCTNLGELTSYLGLRITRDRAQRTITLTQSHMVQQVLQRFDFTYSSPQSTPLPTGHSLSAPPSDKSIGPSGPYPELVGCLMYLMTCTRPDLAYPLNLLACYVAPGRHRKVHCDAAKRVLRYLCSTLGMGLVLGGRSRVVLTGHADACWELRWLTYLLTDLGEAPHSPLVLYVDNKAMLALCQEHRLEHRTKHIALRYFLARELQQRGQLRLAYVASQANTADVFTKALQPCDHQQFCTVLGLFYHPTSHRVLYSQDVTFDELVSYYRFFPYRTASLPPPPLFLAPGAPPVDPLPPQGPAPSGVSQVDPVEPVEEAVDSGHARGAEPAGAGPRVAEPAGAGPRGAEPRGAKPERVEPGGAEPGGAESGGAEPGGAEPERAESGGPLGVPRADGATRPPGGAAGGATGAAAAGGATGAGPDGAAGPGAGGTGSVGGSAGVGAAGGAGAAGPKGAHTGGTGAAGDGGAVGVGAVGAGALATGGAAGAGAAGGTRAGGAAGVVAGDPRAEGTGAVSAVSGGAVRPQPQPSPYSGPTRSLTERREPESRPALPESRPASPESRPESPVCTVRIGARVPRQRPPPVPGTHSMTLRPSTAPQRVPLPSPPASSLPDGPDPESGSLRAASPSVTRFLATAVTDPSFESTAASALVAKLVEFATACRLDFAASLVAESESTSVCPPSVGGECALGTDVLEEKQEEFECFAAALPHLTSMLLAPEGDPDALDIPTPRSYAEAIEGPYSSHWQKSMDTEMASWKSTGTYVDEVPPPGANIGVDFFHTFSPTPKMTTLRVLLHVAAQRDYELHSLDFITAFLQGSLHEEIWLRRPPGFTWSFLAGTQWSLRRPVYGLRQAPLFATADTEALAPVKSELQKRHTCTDLGELTSYLGLRITRDRAQRTITLTQSHMVQQVLQRFGFTYSSPQSTPLPTGHSLSAPPSDESVEPSGPYPELVGCLMYLMTCTRPDLAYPLSLLARYVAPGRHRKVHWDAAKRVLHYMCSTLGMGLVLGGWARVVLTGHAHASWVDDLAEQRSSQGYTFSPRSGSVSWRSTRSSFVLSSCCEAEIYAGAMAAEELRWLTYLLTNLGEVPRSPPVPYVDNKAMLALC
ncbi:unnamed protein product, partial [Closterium sp. NIES-54]